MLSEVNTLLKYKDLFFVFIWREFSIRYRQSVIGVAWAIIQPLSMMFLFTIVFTYIMPVRIVNYPYPVFFYASLLPWSFFSSSLSYSIPSLVAHYSLITKIYFPREIIPISGIAVAFVDLVISSVIFVGLLFFYKIPITASSLLVFPLLLILVPFTITVALFLSALNVYYRDVNLAVNFLIQLWFFATPVFYSIDNVSPNLKIILFLNPLTFIVENMRRCMIEGRSLVWWQYLIMLVFTLCLLFAGYKFFKITEKKFADVI